jgi:rSAM/selenodomain-associated transferase 1
MKRAVVVMGRIPRAGRVKTRLAPSLPLEAAAKLYAAFLADVFALVDRVPSVDRLFACGLGDDERLLDAKRLAPEGWRTIAQRGGDLGARMEAAREDAHADQVAIIGSDSPMMDPSRIVRALEALEDRTAVLGPTDDGGYDLIAFSSPSPELLRDVPWSTDRVAETTRLRAREAGIRLVELERGYDLDTLADLARALADSRTPARSQGAIREALASMGSRH